MNSTLNFLMSFTIHPSSFILFNIHHPSSIHSFFLIEVAFDIDADGILNVSAKDKGTGKEQNIVIRSSGGLSDEDIEQMVADAEANAEADNERRQIIEAKNEIDSLSYSTQKSLDEHGDKLDAEVKAEIEKAIAEAKEVADDASLETIKGKVEALNQASLKIGQAVYGQQQGDGATPEGEEKKEDDNTVDADFKEKDAKDEKEEKK